MNLNNRGAVPTLRARSVLLCGCFSTMLMLYASPGHAGVLLCEAGASLEILDALSTSAALGDFTLACGGGAVTDPIQTADVQVFFNAPLLQTGTPIMTDGLTDYPGSFVGSNSVSFAGILFDPVASSFAVQQILVNPSLQTEDFQYVAFMSVTAAPPIPIDNPQQLLAINRAFPLNVPEPGAGSLLTMGGAALLAWRQRRPATARASTA